MKTKKRAAASKKRAPKAKPKAKAAKGFYATGKRGPRGLKRSPLHVLITPDERTKLVKLTHAMKCSAADVVRALISKAK